jgi:3-methyladenine DNA glycosylase AlkD
MHKAIRDRLQQLANSKDAEIQQRFFKTGKGEYGEGDVFIGVRVPLIRKLAREFRHAPLKAVQQLLRSKIHEQRLLALIMLIDHFQRADADGQQAIYDYYLDHTRYINNWDLVDVSAEKIVGAYLSQRNRQRLYELARSDNLWERRIAIMSSFHFIKQGDVDDTLKLAALLLNDDADLIHKAVGWMLREVGKRNGTAQAQFLQQHYHDMPRTMLRYAIEKLPPATRKKYLAGRI